MIMFPPVCQCNVTSGATGPSQISQYHRSWNISSALCISHTHYEHSLKEKYSESTQGNEGKVRFFTVIGHLIVDAITISCMTMGAVLRELEDEVVCI